MIDSALSRDFHPNSVRVAHSPTAATIVYQHQPMSIDVVVMQADSILLAIRLHRIARQYCRQFANNTIEPTI
jgi:hypothetical protein